MSHGRVLNPGLAVFKVAEKYGATDNAVERTRQLWEQEYESQSFLGNPVAEESSSNSGLNYDIVAASERQRTFLWQISGPRFDDSSFLSDAIERYGKFLKMMEVHGYHNHFFVPTYDIDLGWHTHMLKDTEAYLKKGLYF